MKYSFDGILYDTKEQAEQAVDEYAVTHFDEYLNETFGEVCVAGYTYPCSYAFENIDPIAYRVSIGDYSNMLLNDIEEIE